MSSQSRTLIYALPLDAAERVRDEFLGGIDADLGPDDHSIRLYSASRNNRVEASLQPLPLIRTAGITGLAHLEALAGLRADTPDTGDLPAADHGAVLSDVPGRLPRHPGRRAGAGPGRRPRVLALLTGAACRC